MIRHYVIVAACSLVIAGGVSRNTSIAARQGLAAPTVNTSMAGTGESRTPLGDGRWLLVGGQRENGPVPTVSIFDPTTRTTVQLAQQLHEARAWHSATVLPDGAILVAGGFGAGGRPIAASERFDPATETLTPIQMAGMAARARHTATHCRRPDG